MDNYEKLWEYVQQIYPASPLPAATLQLELDQFLSKLLNLFHNKVMLQHKVHQVLSVGQTGCPSTECSSQL